MGHLTERALFVMSNVYCVNDNLLQSELQTSGAHTAFKNAVYLQTSKIAKDMNSSDMWWSAYDKKWEGNYWQIGLAKWTPTYKSMK